MGCNCGKSTPRPVTTQQSNIAPLKAGTPAVVAAQTYQSGTMQSAPQAAVRQTV